MAIVALTANQNIEHSIVKRWGSSISASSEVNVSRSSPTKPGRPKMTAPG